MTRIHKSYRILIVDDDKTFLNIITELLQSVTERIVIETATSGKECLKKVKKFSPNLVFLDIGMEGMNGLVTLRFIKSINSETPVYLLTGHPKEYLKDAAGMVSADGYFTKPHFIDILREHRSLEMIMNAGKIKT